MNQMLKVLFALVLLAGMASAGLSVDTFSVSQASFKPGASGIITLQVSNPLVTGTTVKSISSVSMEIFPPPEITVTGQQFIGSIEPGGITQISLPFTVNASAKSAIYTVDIKLTGISDRAEGGFDTFSRSTTIPVTVLNAPILSLSTNKQVIGGVDSLAITVHDDGGPATNLKLKIGTSSALVTTSGASSAGQSTTTTGATSSSQSANAASMSTFIPYSQVALAGADQIFIPAIKQQGNVTVNALLDSRNALKDGAVDVPFTLEYNDELGLPHFDQTYLRLTVKNEVLDLKFSQLSGLVTRQDGTLSLEVTNNGQASLSDVRISFTNTSMRLKDKNEMLVGDLGPGAKASVSGAVYPDLAPGLNLVGAKVSWIEGDIRKEQALDIPLTIASDADVSVYLDSTPSPLTSGQEHTISVLVSNVGSYGIDNVDVGINSTAFESLDITPRQYIGSLAKDDFSTVQFKVKVDAAAGDYPIDINVRYRDASGLWVAKDINQVASVKAAASSGAGTLYVIVGIAVLAALAVWYFRFRKKG